MRPNCQLFKKTGWIFLIYAIPLFFVAGPAAADQVTKLNSETVPTAVKGTMQALWTGDEFAPALTKKHKAIKKMLANGELTGATLRKMLKNSIPGILENQKVSRYVLQKIPDRVQDLFAPAVTWEDIKKIIWETGASRIPDNQQLVIKIGTLAPQGTPWLSIPNRLLLPKVKKLSKGRVILKIYGGGVMGEDTDILRKMDIGQLESCGCTALGVLKASPDVSVFLVPGLFNNYDEIDYIFKKFRKRIDKSFEKRGYILAALIDTGWFYVFSKNKITDLDDIRQQKMLTWFKTMETTLYEELGINPTPVSVPEVVSALSTGMADTCLSPSGWMLGMQAYQYVNYYIKEPWLYSPAAVIVSTKTIKNRLQKEIGLSENFAHNLQEMVVFECNLVEKKWRDHIRSYETKSLQAFEKKCGMRPVTLPPEDQKQLAAAAKEVRKRLAGKAFPEDLLNDVRKALEEYRAHQNIDD